MQVAVIGTGHVGLVTCVTFAALGHEVIGTDSDEDKIEALKDRVVPFYEPGVVELLHEGFENGRLSFVSDYADAVPQADVVFICVGTPARASGESNLIAVEKAAREVARYALGRTVLAEKSTVPAGTADRLRRAIQLERPDTDELEVVSNPEFLREGKAVSDSLAPDRILVGAESETAFQTMRELYSPLTRKGIPLIETNIKTAELAKHACNAFLALKISYANALSRLCEKAGADVVAVTEVMGHDSRIGSQFLRAGLGYGGYCFPKDLVAFERLASQLGYEFGLLSEVAKINDQAIEATADKVKDALWNLDDKRIAVLGLSFKPGTDDVRLSPALTLIRRLLGDGAEVVGYDPEARDGAKREVPQMKVVDDAYDAVADAHCVVLATEWDEFARLDLAKMRELMAYPIVVDARNLFDPAEMAQAGFVYYPTGRPTT
jgi:UDPglucose 6-dehydrogenase